MISPMYPTRTLTLLLAIFCLVGSYNLASQARPVTVEDTIAYKTLADEGAYENDDIGEVAQFSPDQSKFVIVTRKGDPKRLLNVYEMLVYRTSDALKGAQPFLKEEYDSTSNRPGISQVQWSLSGDRLTFIGETPTEIAQVRELDINTGRVRTLTANKMPVVRYSKNDDSDAVAYIAQAPWRSIWNDQTRRDGVQVTGQRLEDLVAGRTGYAFRGLPDEFELFFTADGVDRQIPVSGHIPSGSVLSLSPDARHLLVNVSVAKSALPAAWAKLPYSWMKVFEMKEILREISDTYFSLDTVIDLKTDASRVLQPNPSADVFVRKANVVWLTDRNSVVLRAFAPDSANVKDARNGIDLPPSVEIELNTLRETAIGANCVDPIGWNARDRVLHCKGKGKNVENNDAESAPDMYFAADGATWRPSATLLSMATSAELWIEEDFQHPPRIMIGHPGRSDPRLLLDLDPQVKDLSLAHSEQISFVLKSGERMQAGLFYPSGYVKGHKYPLVVQTHAWNPKRLKLDGPFATGYATEVLSSRGFFVLQVNEETMDYQALTTNSRADVDRALDVYRTAIDYLTARDLVDPSRVGVLGFSHTCFYVKYALAHTSLFAAASIAEGEDGGYLQYVTQNNMYVDSDSLYGGPPYGDSLQSWIKESPGFNLASVSAPLRIATLNPRFIISDWEWFAGLQTLNKPVDLVMFEDGEHVLKKPSQRLVADQGNVDWFDFWLNGHEDAAPDKRAQYARWEKLCDDTSLTVQKDARSCRRATQR